MISGALASEGKFTIRHRCEARKVIEPNFDEPPIAPIPGPLNGRAAKLGWVTGIIVPRTKR